MWLTNFVNKLKEQETQKSAEIQRMSENPRFSGMDVTKIALHPIDGDKDRMALYGCYAGDTFSYKGQTYTVEKDDVERIKITPQYTKVDGDKYRYSKPPKEIQKQWDQAKSDARKRMYMGNFKPGDVVENETYTFKYRSQELTEDYGPHGDYTRTIGYHNGWSISCRDKTTPMKDVVMPDEFLGESVMFAERCFENCKNVASVAHISSDALSHGYINNMFSHSGLREVPHELLTDIQRNKHKIQISCGYAYAIHNAKELHDALTSIQSFGNKSGLYMFAQQELAQQHIQELKNNKETEAENIRGEFSSYQKAEKVSFVYDFRPLTLYRAQGMNGDLFVVNPNGPHQAPLYQGGHFEQSVMTLHDGYGGFMSKFDESKIQGLTSDSFTPVSMDELSDYIEKVYDKTIERVEANLTKEITKVSKELTNARAEADRAQEGLDFKPRKDDFDKLINNTREDHEKGIE